jgi:hypothetical protein
MGALLLPRRIISSLLAVNRLPSWINRLAVAALKYNPPAIPINGLVSLPHANPRPEVFLVNKLEVVFEKT